MIPLFFIIMYSNKYSKKYLIKQTNVRIMY